MKITLIHPPMPSMTDRRISPPLGILYLASYLRQRLDVDLQVIDQNLNEDISVDYCIRQALEAKADIYGISFGSPQYHYAVAISRALKNQRPDASIICGGPHPSALPAETIFDTGCDAVFESESEETVYEFVRECIGGNFNPAHIKGIHYLNGGQNCLYSGPRPFIRELDSIPFPARDLVDFKKYTRTIDGEPATTIITARGCPGKCIFCSQHSWKNSLRLRSVVNIIQEIDHIRNAYSVKNVLFLDDTLTVNYRRILQLCNELKDRGVKWRGWTRANLINQNLADKMAESNCMALCIGVESGSQTILNQLRKGTTVEENRQAIKYIKNSDIKARISLIVGSPGETWDTIRETLDFVIETQPDDWLLSIFVPVPGSQAYANPEKYGIRFLNGVDNRIDKFRNFFVTGGDMESGRVMEYDGLAADEILAMRNFIYEELMEKCPPKLHRSEGIR
jgi:anaerobic magnesium-protoporphyrin IX monomethyl ester cyclase